MSNEVIDSIIHPYKQTKTGSAIGAGLGFLFTIGVTKNPILVIAGTLTGLIGGSKIQRAFASEKPLATKMPLSDADVDKLRADGNDSNFGLQGMELGDLVVKR